MPVQFGIEPALSCPFRDLQRIIQLNQTFLKLSCKTAGASQKRSIVRHEHLCPGGAVSAQTAVQERYPFDDITIFDLAPSTIDPSHSSPIGETVLVGHCD